MPILGRAAARAASQARELVAGGASATHWAKWLRKEGMDTDRSRDCIPGAKRGRECAIQAGSAEDHNNVHVRHRLGREDDGKGTCQAETSRRSGSVP
eukprot:3692481-Amphidinium_carterae.3